MAKNSSSTEKNVEAIIDRKMGTFLNTLHEKDKVIEDKNNVIFMLQQRIGELETRLQTMIALPDYNSEKQNTMLEKQRLETKIMQLQDGLKKEKNKSLLFLGVVVVIILMYLILSSI
jgi:tRNA U34 5-carboxymethylaminomethyl modifying GTPase MnmE/TrmE